MSQGQIAVLASIILGGCISVDVGEPVLPACVAQTAPAPVASASAVVELDLVEPLYESCNAVAIAPTLLLTAVNCVTPLLSADDDAGFILPQCTPTGAAIEDGRFLSRYTPETAPLSSLELVRGDGTLLEAGVSAVFVSSATSTCAPDFAIVQTQLALDVTPVPIRLQPAEHPGDEVIIIGYELIEGRLERRTSPATIIEATSDQGSPTLPPRSLTLSGDTCTRQGGAVIAAETGALVGLIQTTDRTINCVTAMGSPVAVRVAPYRQFILEVARETQTSLIAEIGSEQVGLMECEGI